MGVVCSLCLKSEDHSEEQDPLLQQQKYLQRQQDAEYLEQEEQRKMMELEEQKILKREHELTEIVNSTNDAYVDISMINNGNSVMNDAITATASDDNSNNSNNNNDSNNVSSTTIILGNQSYKRVDPQTHLSDSEREALMAVWDVTVGVYIKKLKYTTENIKIGPLVVEL